MECHFCATACIVDTKSKKILFIHHRKLNKWLFVGGHIEKNENPEEAVIREIKEETGLNVELRGKRYPREQDFIIPFALQKNVIDDNHVHMDIFYIATLKENSSVNVKKDEIINYRWFSIEEIQFEDFDTFPEKKQMAIDVLKMFN